MPEDKDREMPPWEDPPRRRQVPQEQADAFVRRCYLCHHWTLDVWDSGLPVYSACRHVDHAPGREPYPCQNLAHEYEGRRCPRFWPVVLRAPHRVALRVIGDILTRNGL